VAAAPQKAAGERGILEIKENHGDTERTEEERKRETQSP
jgi:hypothetical protein